MDRFDYDNDNIASWDKHWYAVDQEDRIAEFWTCGGLPMPGRIGHDDIQRIEYFADILHGNDGTKKSSAGSDTLFNFYAYDDCHNKNRAEFPYWRREFSGKPVTLDDLPDEIRRSFKIRLSLSFADDERIPMSAIPDRIGNRVSVIPLTETEEDVRHEREEGTRLWKEMQQRFGLRFEKHHGPYVLLSEQPDYLQYCRPFCPDCYENSGIYYSWLIIHMGEEPFYDSSGKLIRPAIDEHWRCKNCEKDFMMPLNWRRPQIPVRGAPEGIPEGSCDLTDLKLPIPKPDGFWQSLKKRLFG